MPSKHLVQEMPPLLFIDEGQNCREGSAHIPFNTELQRCPTAQSGRVTVDLDRVCLREEIIVGEVSAEHYQQVGFVARFVAGPIAEKSGHTDVRGVVELDPLFAAKSVA